MQQERVSSHGDACGFSDDMKSSHSSRRKRMTYLRPDDQYDFAVESSAPCSAEKEGPWPAMDRNLGVIDRL